MDGFDLINVPIKQLPPKGGRFAKLKRETSRLRDTGSIRDIIEGIRIGRHKYFSASAYKQILMFLIEEDHIK